MNTLSIVHDFLRRTVRPGSLCIDATAGRVRDTALLCELAGEGGRVLAFDVQEDAVRQTNELLAREGKHAEVHLDSHAHMESYAAPESVDCNIFDLTEEERKSRGIEAVPASLREAVSELEKDELIREVLGVHMADKYIRAKKEEWEKYTAQVTEWEISQYLNQY